MSHHVTQFRWIMPAVAACIITVPAAAQQGRVFTNADYDHALQVSGGGGGGGRGGAAAGPGTVAPHWLTGPSAKLWYRNVDGDVSTFYLVDPVKKTKLPAFNHAKLAVALSKVAGKTYEATKLPFQEILFSTDQKTVSFNIDGKGYSCGVSGSSCRALPAAVVFPSAAEEGGGFGGRGGRGGRGGVPAGRGGAGGGPPVSMAPGTSHGVFIRNWNLILRDTATKRDTPLTTDGTENNGYATSNAGWSYSEAAFGVWSPDGNKFFTHQQDERKVGDMYLVYTPPQGGHPTLEAWKYPLPGDSVVAMVSRVIVDVAAHKVIRLQMPPDFHRGSTGDNLSAADIVWSPDNSKVALISTSRDHKKETVRLVDAATGSVRTIFEETVPTQFELRGGWKVLWPTNEIIWYSNRDNHGQYYLYDMNTGQLKNRITSGTVNATGIDKIDEKTRTIWFSALGGEAGQNPYFVHYYMAKLDGSKQVSLTPDDGTNSAPSMSPDGKYLVANFSQTDVPPAGTLRSAVDGSLILPLEKADKAKLTAAGVRSPTMIHMKAADGKTDIYGDMYTPTNLDPNRKYPVINHIYPGPQSGSTNAWGWRTASGEAQGLAELGFIVVEIDSRGSTPNRDKDFIDAYYGAMGRDNGLADQVAGMQQLAKQYPFIDINKAGIYGHSGGGFATADAMFRFPDFFKVGISESGNDDQREYEDDWGERYQGLDTKTGPHNDSYWEEANQNVAKNLKGHLLLAHGSVDNNVPPYNTLAVVRALVDANKDFDLLFLPNERHGYCSGQYMQRRRWDYFIRYLMEATPPKEYDMSAGGGRGGRGGGAAGGGAACGSMPAARPGGAVGLGGN